MGEAEFFCKNFLLMFTALNFFGCGVMTVELLDAEETAVLMVGLATELDSLEALGDSFVAASGLANSEGFSGTAGVEDVLSG